MADSSVALRVISPRSNVLGTDDPDALQNLDTTDLPDGAICVVPGTGVYLLDKSSTATPVGVLVVAPASGPGLWTFLSAAQTADTILSAHSALSITSSGVTVATSGGQNKWTAFPVTAYDGDFDSTLWSFNDITGVLTYLGPLRQFEITAYLSAAPTSAAAALIGLDIDVNGDILGTTNRTIETMEVLTGAATADQVSLSTSRIRGIPTNGTVQAVARNGAAAIDLKAFALTLVVRPF